MPELMRKFREQKSKWHERRAKKARLQQCGGVIEEEKVAALPEQLEAMNKKAEYDELLTGRTHKILVFPRNSMSEVIFISSNGQSDQNVPSSLYHNHPFKCFSASCYRFCPQT